MKTPFIVSILLFCIALTSCNTSEYMENPQEEIPFEENVPYSFDKITNPAVWAKFNSLKEMQDACQMPENWLKNISTENLVKTCMNYPLYGMYMAYNNEMQGVKITMDGFNGFQELMKRKDAAEKLLDFYEQFGTHTKASDTGHDILRLGFIELVLSSGNIPHIFNEESCVRARELMNEKYQMKLKDKDIYSIHSVKNSLVLGAKIQLESSSVSSADSSILFNFIEQGGNVADTKTYTTVSNLIAR